MNLFRTINPGHANVRCGYNRLDDFEGRFFAGISCLPHPPLAATPRARKPGRQRASPSSCRSRPAPRPTSARASMPSGCRRCGASRSWSTTRAAATASRPPKSVARAKPDGLTIFATSAMTQAVNPAIYDKLPYDPVAELRADHAHGHLAVRAAGRRATARSTSAAELTAKLKADAGQEQLRRRRAAGARRVRALQDGGRRRGRLCRLQEQSAGDPRRAERPAHPS